MTTVLKFIARDATCRTLGGILVVFTFLLNTPWGFPSCPQ